ncbi:hypothetical protein COOONC_01382, partial [Cooperia oncophora]
LPHLGDSPEDRCLNCQVSFKEKERSATTPQYCSTKCRRAYQARLAKEKSCRKFSENMKRISGGSEGTTSSSSSSVYDMKMKMDEEHTYPLSKSKRFEEPSPSKKVVKEFPTPIPRSTMNSPTILVEQTPVVEPTVCVTTPVAMSCGPLNVPGVDYDVDPKLWTPDVAARWAQGVTGSETCAATFLREDVDGDAMLMMGFDDLRSHLSFTFGPAKKLQLAIEQLKVFRDQRYGTP